MDVAWPISSWHADRPVTAMISQYTPSALPDTAPPIIHELRHAFEERMTAFWERLRGEGVAYTADGIERTSHVHFTYGTLHVVAVFSHVADRFTQLIARDADEPGLDRPSYIISIFL